MPRLMFQRPRRIEWEDLTPVFGRMVAEPFEKGYALTVGNSLRRVLLSAVPGAAVAWARVDGVAGDELTALLLNIKKIVVRLPEGAAATAKASVKGPKAVTAGDLTGAGIEILNPELPLVSVEAGGRLSLEIGARVGRGYVSAERQLEAPPAGAIALDSAFSPIRRVNYTVEMSRLGNITDYEKLLVEVATDGSVSPDQALLRASKLLRDHFDLFTPAGADEEDDEPPAAGEVTGRS